MFQHVEADHGVGLADERDEIRWRAQVTAQQPHVGAELETHAEPGQVLASISLAM